MTGVQTCALPISHLFNVSISYFKKKVYILYYVARLPVRVLAAATAVDIPTDWFDSRTGQIKNALAHCAKAFL